MISHRPSKEEKEAITSQELYFGDLRQLVISEKEIKKIHQQHLTEVYAERELFYHLGKFYDFVQEEPINLSRLEKSYIIPIIQTLKDQEETNFRLTYQKFCITGLNRAMFITPQKDIYCYDLNIVNLQDQDLIKGEKSEILIIKPSTLGNFL